MAVSGVELKSGWSKVRAESSICGVWGGGWGGSWTQQDVE